MTLLRDAKNKYNYNRHYSVFDKLDNLKELGKTESGKILIADDDNLCAISLFEKLSGYGYRVVRTENGIEFVNKFSESEEGEYSALLVDCHMPGLGGLDAIKMIREMDRADARSIPIFMCTASMSEDEFSKLFLYGGNGCFYKPVNIVQIIKTIKNECKIVHSSGTDHLIFRNAGSVSHVF